MSELVDWSPDSDYEIIRCNKTPEEMQKIIENGLREVKNDNAATATMG